MARIKSPDFLERLIQTAMQVFARKGLKGTRMSDIAREMGVSQGTLYNYVESKEALFYLLVDQGMRSAPLELPPLLPIPTPDPEQLLRRVEEQIETAFDLVLLNQALERETPENVAAELRGIVRELYEKIEQTREPAAVLERSAYDLPELFTIFFVWVRRNLLARLTKYIRQRMEKGYFRPVGDPATAARFVVESVTFFARHRHGDPDLPLGDDTAVRETVVPLIVRSLIGAEPKEG